MSFKAPPQAQLNVDNGSRRGERKLDFLDWYPFSFDYLKDFIRPRDDWVVSQYLYDLFNKKVDSVPEVPVVAEVPGDTKQDANSPTVRANLPMVRSAPKKRSRKTCKHLRALDLDLESIRVSPNTINHRDTHNRFFCYCAGEEGSVNHLRRHWRNIPIEPDSADQNNQ